MLKRNIAILIAGGLLGVQANLAGAGDSNVYILPAQQKYFDEHPPVHTPSPMDNDVFPRDYGGD